MESRFKKVTLHTSERADETWINPDHVVAVTPDPKGRYMTVVFDVLDPGRLSWGPKIYRITVESGRELLGIG